MLSSFATCYPTLDHWTTGPLDHRPPTTPLLHYSSTPVLQFSQAPPPHHSITPSLQFFRTPPLHHSNSPRGISISTPPVPVWLRRRAWVEYSGPGPAGGPPCFRFLL